MVIVLFPGQQVGRKCSELQYVSVQGLLKRQDFGIQVFLLEWRSVLTWSALNFIARVGDLSSHISSSGVSSTGNSEELDLISHLPHPLWLQHPVSITFSVVNMWIYDIWITSWTLWKNVVTKLHLQHSWTVDWEFLQNPRCMVQHIIWTSSLCWSDNFTTCLYVLLHCPMHSVPDSFIFLVCYRWIELMSYILSYLTDYYFLNLFNQILI